MRNAEFAPLFRSTVGFDRLFDMLENSVRTDWPPYNIEKTGDDQYKIAMAVAGFGPEEVELTQHGAELIVVGQKKPEDDASQVLHRGLANRAFKQVFRLADHVKVANASLKNGLLTVDLVREIPEAMKPRRIEISSDAGGGSIEANSNVEQIDQASRKERKAA